MTFELIQNDPARSINHRTRLRKPQIHIVSCGRSIHPSIVIPRVSLVLHAFINVYSTRFSELTSSTQHSKLVREYHSACDQQNKPGLHA